MKWWSAALGVLFLQTLSFGQEKESGFQEGLLWKIEKKGQSSASYVFGTIHMIPKEKYFLPPGFNVAFNKCSRIFMEIDMDDMNDLSKIMGIMDKVFMEDDKKLSDLLQEEEYSKIKDYFDHMGLPMMMLDRMKPLFLNALAGTDGNPMALKDGSYKSYEMELSQMAEKSNKELLGLETIDFQLSIFDKIPYKVQAKMLFDAVSADSSKSDHTDVMFDQYVKQDLHQMSESIETGDLSLKPYLSLLLFERNKDWIPKMKAEMEKGSCFFAVGAGHLGGQGGVLQLLSNEGYSISRVKE